MTINADVVMGWRQKRVDPIHRKIFSFFFKIIFILLFSDMIRDPSCSFVLFKRQTILPHIAFLNYLNEGFLWGFIGLCLKKHISIYQVPINHRRRIMGDTQVYKVNKLFGIVVRNLTGIFRLKFTN